MTKTHYLTRALSALMFLLISCNMFTPRSSQPMPNRSITATVGPCITTLDSEFEPYGPVQIQPGDTLYIPFKKNGELQGITCNPGIVSITAQIFQIGSYPKDETILFPTGYDCKTYNQDGIELNTVMSWESSACVYLYPTTETPTETATPQPSATFTATATAMLLDGVSFGSNTTVGQDGTEDDKHVSVIFWNWGEEGYILTSSADHVKWGLGDAGQTDMTPLRPDDQNAFESCHITKKGIGDGDVTIEPKCYRMRIPKEARTLQVPGLVYFYGKYDTGSLDGGATNYAPREPSPTPGPVTPSATPTITLTPRPTQSLALPTPVSNDSQIPPCIGANQVLTYAVNFDPKKSECVSTRTNFPTQTATFRVDGKEYVISFYVNRATLNVAYILGGAFDTATTSCILNGTTFTGGKTNNVQLNGGNLNSRLECTTSDGKIFYVTADA